MLIATDERGGGVAAAGRHLRPGADNTAGNGGVHFYRIAGQLATTPGSPEEAFSAYARTPEGEKAIFRAPIRTQPQAPLCTAHVFQQIPGQNRIFMGWYSQGTQVVDFVEKPRRHAQLQGGRLLHPRERQQVGLRRLQAGSRTPTAPSPTAARPATSTSALAGRSAIDVYKVTLPAPPQPRVGITTTTSVVS